MSGRWSLEGEGGRKIEEGGEIPGGGEGKEVNGGKGAVGVGRRGEERGVKGGERERKSWKRGEEGAVLRSPPQTRGGGREWRKEERRGRKDKEESGWE